MSCCGRVMLSSWVVCAILVSGGAVAAGAPVTQPAGILAQAPAVLNPAIRELFDHLGSDDARQREEATQQLGNYGTLIRPALLEAARHGEPAEVRLRAARVLCQISWAAPSDPAGVRQILGDYCSPEAEVRANTVRRLGGVGGDEALATLVRLMGEDPSEDVRWVIEQRLRSFHGDAERQRLRQALTGAVDAADDPPALAAAGWAWRGADTGKSLALLRRAADLAAEHAADDGGEIAEIRHVLHVRAMNVGDYDEAVEQTRRSLLADGDRPLSESLLDLFVLHAQYGPRRGFERDVRMAHESFYSPEMMYVMGRMYARLNQPLVATALYRGAGLAALSTQLTHKRLAEFLQTHQWYELAEVEYRAVLATNGPDKAIYDADAYVGLSRCAAGLGDDAKAAELLTTAMKMAAALPNRQINNEGEFRAEIDWHALRAAKARGDWAEVEQHIDSLMALKTTNPEVGIDVVSSLKHLGRGEEAAAEFGKFFSVYRKELAEDPHDPEVLNNIAWLCARCDEHLEEAERWSSEAIRLAPANGAYLDTAAEATARVGKWSEAAKLEAAALEMTPGDRFMMGQLERFRRGEGKER